MTQREINELKRLADNPTKWPDEVLEKILAAVAAKRLDYWRWN